MPDNHNPVTAGGSPGPAPAPPALGDVLRKVLLATTPAAGTVLVNGTPTILSWTAPNDGRPHRLTLFAQLNVGTTETGGQVNLNVGGAALTLFSAALPAGVHLSSAGVDGVIVQPGQTVTITQATALTVGAATLFAELWGS